MEGVRRRQREHAAGEMPESKLVRVVLQARVLGRHFTEAAIGEAISADARCYIKSQSAVAKAMADKNAKRGTRW